MALHLSNSEECKMFHPLGLPHAFYAPRINNFIQWENYYSKPEESAGFND